MLEKESPLVHVAWEGFNSNRQLGMWTTLSYHYQERLLKEVRRNGMKLKFQFWKKLGLEAVLYHTFTFKGIVECNTTQAYLRKKQACMRDAGAVCFIETSHQEKG